MTDKTNYTWMYQLDGNHFGLFCGSKRIGTIIDKDNADFIIEKLNANHEYHLINLLNGLTQLMAKHGRFNE